MRYRDGDAKMPDKQPTGAVRRNDASPQLSAALPSLPLCSPPPARGGSSHRRISTALRRFTIASSLSPPPRRSVIAALASEDHEERRRAFDTFVALYWKPLYKYLRVARGRQVADAEDSTQSFL